MSETKRVLFVGGPRDGLTDVGENHIGVRHESYRGPKGWYRKTSRTVEVWEYELPVGEETA